VWEAAVEDVGAAHAAADRGDAGADLRDHAVGDLAGLEELLEALGVDVGDERLLVTEVSVDAGDVGEVDELLGVEGFGDRRGDRVGVDVVGLAALVDPDGSDDRNELFAEEAFEDGGLDAADVADEAEVGDRAARR